MIDRPQSAAVVVLSTFQTPDQAAEVARKLVGEGLAACVNLVPAIREELILAIPAYVVCRDDCRGLCPQCGRELNTGPCGCTPPTESWRPLAALKDKLRNS